MRGQQAGPQLAPKQGCALLAQHNVTQGHTALLPEAKPAAEQPLYPQELLRTWWGSRNPKANPASLPTSMLDLESPITGSSKVRTSSRLEPAYASPSLWRVQGSVRREHERGATPPCTARGSWGRALTQKWLQSSWCCCCGGHSRTGGPGQGHTRSSPLS